MKIQKWGFLIPLSMVIIALPIITVGLGIAFYGNYSGVGIAGAGIAVAIVNIILVLKRTEYRCKQLEKEIELLKNK